MPRYVIVSALALAAGAATAQGQAPSALDRGLALYRQNELEEALPQLEAAVERHPDDTDARSYLAETLRRLNRQAEAVAHARAVLERRPCDGFAHTILGDSYAPQYSGWEYANADSAWAHFLAAVACDEDFGHAWLSVWFEAMRRRERALEERALRRLIETQFLTPPVLAYNRWVLTTLPDSALLLTNGDWDTYPALALQVVERLRPDVAIVNISMMAQPWYLRVSHERHGLPLAGYDPDFPVRSERVIGVWRQLSAQGALGRPLHAALTVPRSSIEGSAGSWQLTGPAWHLVPQPDVPEVDTAAVRKALLSVRPRDLAGPATSPGDHSPVRISAGNTFGLNALFVGLLYGRAVLQHGRTAEVRRIVDWADALIVEAGVPNAQEYVERLRAALEEQPND